MVNLAHSNTQLLWRNERTALIVRSLMDKDYLEWPGSVDALLLLCCSSGNGYHFNKIPYQPG